MTETVLKINISELATVRVECKNCNMITETKIGDLSKMISSECRHCQNPFFDARYNSGENPFLKLQNGIQGFQGVPAVIEFVIPVDEAE